MADLMVPGRDRRRPPRRSGTTRPALPSSGNPATEARRKDVQLLTVLGDRATGDPQALFVEKLGDPLIRQRLLLVLLVDQRLDDVLGGACGNVFTILGLEPAREEELELEHAARRLHVLAAAHPADGRLVHVDLARHLLERQRAQEGDPLVEELALLPDDAVH